MQVRFRTNMHLRHCVFLTECMSGSSHDLFLLLFSFLPRINNPKITTDFIWTETFFYL